MKPNTVVEQHEWLRQLVGEWNASGCMAGSDDLSEFRAEADAPSIEDTTRIPKYHDQIEIVDAGTKRMTSSMLSPDGMWNTFMTIDATRA